LPDRLGETPFLRRAGETLRQGRIAASRLDDQDVDLRLWECRAFGQRLVVKVYVAGVEDCAPFRAE
jgi:hypothetical protein